jgi:hypothetical protein
MEIPLTSAADGAAAVRDGDKIQQQLTRQIPNHDWLFQ